MTPRRVLDLFCGAGGAAMGLHRAWPDAEIVGVDIKPQPRYPFTFIHGDALEIKQIGTVLFSGGDFAPRESENDDFAAGAHRGFSGRFDFIWASPPCQCYSIAARKNRNEGVVYPDLIEPCRKLLQSSGCKWTIENVPYAPLRADFTLCGSHFGLPIARHRLFETNFASGAMPPCKHVDDVITICGHGTPQWMRKRRMKLGLHPNASVDVKRAAMEIPWMNREELSQAVPPAYSEYIARQLPA
jgi:DNA (cytosine-5)-methyltransferase 1